ncbi:hypothetical protein IFM89_023775 [Coptis chinensis]|uniref:BZIP domain-containing protein n=1 Tax=Coptis chinensis TaxID=261450 RepID=A0A835IPL4_9MAGN|nr:hypothetical protein IFM89_023775 [Coptis chinensis]
MIKNRESAARSRARKQAYTMQLEAEVAKLKEENNELLKKQAEIIEVQKKEVRIFQLRIKKVLITTIIENPRLEDPFIAKKRIYLENYGNNRNAKKRFAEGRRLAPGNTN